MKIQHGNECIMLFKWEWCDLLLLDAKGNAKRVDVAFSTLLIISGNYLNFLGLTFRHVLAEKKLLQKLDKTKEEEW